ncbi:hypothetical protein [Falsibacillus albus]|uniref:Uncharacterized protein n=1 Tax=Falsibacillus albus TaxID=2478915 RepID=A0A3L7JHL3_9BACI|nr:hypothetical protein [Falsibacillus albus]RLQ89990.1 hypothetical protein D9X91_21905 [Falsibacillus albus]
MKVEEVNMKMSTEDKLHVLQELREDIGEAAFRRAVAAVETKHILELMYYKGKRIERTELCNRVNLTLWGFGCEPMSYSWFRAWL